MEMVVILSACVCLFSFVGYIHVVMWLLLFVRLLVCVSFILCVIEETTSITVIRYIFVCLSVCCFHA